MIDAPGQPFHDPDADAALFEALRSGVGPNVELVEMDCERERRRVRRRDGRAAGLLRERERMTGDEARAKLRATLDGGGVIIGAGAGTGLSAKCAEAGGTDLIIIYNSGRYRMAGRGSLAGLLPYGDANAIVMEMGNEVLPVVRDTPVLAGVCGTDPFRLMPQFLRGGARRGLRRRAELPHRRAHRRHVPREPRGDRDGLRARGRHDPRGVVARAADVALRVRSGERGRDGRGRRRRARAAHGADHQGHDRRPHREDARRVRRGDPGDARRRRRGCAPT